MTLIKSISGIRGTIGGSIGNNLTPIDIVSFTSGFAEVILTKYGSASLVVGRDGRNTGNMVQHLVQSTLIAKGIDILDAGLTTTPSLAMNIIQEKCQGGIMITASHNPMEWNALKFMNEAGEFIDAHTGQLVLDKAADPTVGFSRFDKIGSITPFPNSIKNHIDSICSLSAVRPEMVKQKKYTIVVDAINSTGALAIPPLLEKLGCAVILINGDINGTFNHNPEPIKEHLTDICRAVVSHKADLGIVVDPDVDRLAFVDENGQLFGEEYTLVAVADYITSIKPGPTVSNLSSTLALKDITVQRGGHYFASAVGEVNVVTKMKEVGAVIGGEGNGGVIFPDLHYGRDAMVGIALFLTHLAIKNCSVSELRRFYPIYEMSKNKIELQDKKHIEVIFEQIKKMYSQFNINTVDGVKIEMPQEWIHLRQSNTEPIIRIYAESQSTSKAEALADHMIAAIKDIQKTLS